MCNVWVTAKQGFPLTHVTRVILCIYCFIEYVQKQPHTKSQNLIRYNTHIGRLLLTIFRGSICHVKTTLYVICHTDK